MVQVLTPRLPKKPSLGQRLSEGIGRGLEFGSQLMEQQQQKEIMAKESARIKELTGFDVIDIQDPKIRQKAFKLAMDSKFAKDDLQGKKDLQQQKYQLDQENKEALLNQKLGFLGQKLGGTSQQNESSENQMNQNQENNGFDVTQLTDNDIASIAAVDPNMARALSHSKDVALREKREQRNFEAKEIERSPQYQREKKLTETQASADIEYNKKLQDSTKRTVLKRESLDRLKKLNQKGITGKPYEKLLEKAGLIGLTSEGRREFAAEVKNQFTDFKDIAGSQLTGQEFQTLSNAYPSPDFSKEANNAIIKNLEIVQDTLNEEHKIANRIKKAYGKVPEDFQSKVNEQLEEYAKSRSVEMKDNLRLIQNEELGIPKGHTLMISPNGEELSVPNEEVEKLMNLGAILP